MILAMGERVVTSMRAMMVVRNQACYRTDDSDLAVLEESVL